VRENESQKILIVEDNKDFSSILEIFLKKLGYNNLVVANSFTEGKRLFKLEEPDLAILDVELGEKSSGIDLGHFIRSRDETIPIIYITHNFTDDVYEEALEVKPSSFLNKELSTLKLRQAVDLAFYNLGSLGKNEGIKSGIGPMDFTQDTIFVKVGSNYKRVKLTEIDYFYFEDRYIHLVYLNHTYNISGTMKDLVKTLPGNLFVQIHQSYIVNINKVDKVNFTDNEIEIGEKTFPIGIRFKKTLMSNIKILK
jgi:DNA-binding LytR/AlgR family response regulator